MRKVFRLAFSKKRWLIYLLIALSVVGCYYIVCTIDWSVLREINTPLLGILGIIALLYMLVNTLSTWLLLQGMGYSISFRRLFLVITSSLSTNYVTPVKAGIPIRLWLYKSIMGIPISSGSASMVVETTLGWVIGVILSLIGAQFILRRSDVWPYMTILSILVAFSAILLLLRPQLLDSIVKNLIPSEHAIRITKWGKQFLKSIRAVPMWAVAGMVFLYLLRLSVRAFCLHMALGGLGASSSVLDLVFVQSISGIIGIMSLLPMGIGAKDASLTMLMIQLGVPREVALVGVLIDRSLWTVIPLVTGIISANVLGVSKLTKHPNEPFAGTQEEASCD